MSTYQTSDELRHCVRLRLMFASHKRGESNKRGEEVRPFGAIIETRLVTRVVLARSA